LHGKILVQNYILPVFFTDFLLNFCLLLNDILETGQVESCLRKRFEKIALLFVESEHKLTQITVNVLAQM